MTYRFTAKVEAVGENSLLPHRKDAVDAEVFLDGKWLCDVTLLGHEDGRPGLDTWGSPDHWCSHWSDVQAAARNLEVDLDHLTCEIVKAVEAALTDYQQLKKFS